MSDIRNYYNLSVCPKVSVLMPAYNAGKYISESIDSIIAQTFAEWELVIVDDASTDDTWKKATKYKKKDPRVKVFRNSKNLGISVTRNKLIGLSKGNYIAWQDADDISLPSRIESQFLFMENHPRVGICGGFLEFFSDKGIISTRKYDTSDKELRKKIFFQSPVAQPGAMLRKSVLERAGTFNPELRQAEDADLSFRIGMHAEFANIPNVVIRYRVNDNSATLSKLRENIADTLKVRKWAFEKYGYEMRLADRLAYYITYFFQFVPPKITYSIFNLWRNN
jgi:glycosyltransferase involved in cell wall biosynthesis